MNFKTLFKFINLFVFQVSILGVFFSFFFFLSKIFDALDYRKKNGFLYLEEIHIFISIFLIKTEK